MDPKRHEGKVVIVTGAAHGIGLATAKRFLAEGAKVVVADISEELLAAAKKELDGGENLMFHVTDVSRLESVEEMVEATVGRFGKLDVLVNNAGTAILGTVEEIKPEDWHRVISIDLDSIFYGARAAMPHLRKTKGCIVNTASISGLGANHTLSAYYAAKGGVVNFTRYLAVEHAHEGIRVNAVCPGPVDTWGLFANPPLKAQYDSLVPQGRVGTAEEIAAGISFLASNDEAGYINGHNLVIDGALTAWTGEPDLKPFVDPAMLGQT